MEEWALKQPILGSTHMLWRKYSTIAQKDFFFVVGREYRRHTFILVPSIEHHTTNFDTLPRTFSEAVTRVDK